MLSTGYAIAIILIMSVITFGLRATPFLLFRKGTAPKVITYLGNALPPAVIGMLIVYCLRNVPFQDAPHGAPEGIAILAVALLHLWKGNTMLSILGGTVLYMVLVQVVFV